MKIKFGEIILNKLDSDIQNEEYKYSNLYDVELHSFDMRMQVKGTSKDRFEKVLKESCDGGVYQLDENDEVMREYKVYNKSCSYRGNIDDEITVYNYQLNFEEVINREIESLDIDELNVIPYEYEEEYDNGIIIIAKIKLTKEEMDIFNSIKDGPKYFDVIRNGISNKTIKMRFGKNIWSEDNGIFKLGIVLVEEVYDKYNAGNFDLSELEIRKLIDIVSYQRNFNNELLKILLDKDIVTEEEINDLKLKSEKEINESRRQIYKVEDLDAIKW